MRPFILASASPRRKDLLEKIIPEFSIQPSTLEEVVEPGLSPSEVVESLALQKAQDIAGKQADSCFVLGSDTVVSIHNEILGKPLNEENAFEMLLKLSGKKHTVITGVALIQWPENEIQVTHEVSHVTFKNLNPEEIKAYIKTGEPLDKAGSYAIQGGAGDFVTSVEGPYDNIVGLPLETVKHLLLQFK